MDQDGVCVKHSVVDFTKLIVTVLSIVGVMLHCNPIMEGIRDPKTIMVDIKWWVLDDDKDKTSTESSNEESIVSRRKSVF